MAFATVAAIAGAENVSCQAGKSVECAFNVTNTSGASARLSLVPRVKAPAKDAWFEVLDDIERRISAGESTQVTVRVHIPDGIPTGRYTFSLRAYSTDDPEQFADSPMIAVDVPAATVQTAPPPQPPGFRWWPIALAAVLVVIVMGGGVAYYLSRPEPGAPALVWNQGKWQEAAWQ